jgi:hypothetical protein
MKTVKVYPKKVYGTVANFLAGNHVLQGWVCEHDANGAEPKEEGGIVMCPECGEAFENGAEIVKGA